MKGLIITGGSSGVSQQLWLTKLDLEISYYDAGYGHRYYNTSFMMFTPTSISVNNRDDFTALFEENKTNLVTSLEVIPYYAGNTYYRLKAMSISGSKLFCTIHHYDSTSNTPNVDYSFCEEGYDDRPSGTLISSFSFHSGISRKLL